VITKIIPADTVSLPIVVSVLLAALIWNLITWWYGIPVSSSHCLIASLFGAGITARGLKGVQWDELYTVVAALFISPVVGFIAGWVLTWATLKISKETERVRDPALRTTSEQRAYKEATERIAAADPLESTAEQKAVEPDEAGTQDTQLRSTSELKALPTSELVLLNTSELKALPSGELKAIKSKKSKFKIMRILHVVASASVSFSHGSNDGQKTMGIITLILGTHFAGYTTNAVPLWVICAAATAMSMGTIIGGWRVIRTVGTKISREKLSHSQGFGASMSTAIIILIASAYGWPISTTHTLSSAVAGGTIPAHGKDKLNPKTLKLLASAWILTIPVAALLSAICYSILRVIWHN
jgi:phosphate/sulfate permease